jgi:hypothetical protein
MIHIEQEPDHVPPRPLRWSLLIAIIALVASVAATLVLGAGRRGDVSRVERERPTRLASDPYQRTTEAERREVRARLRLDTYGWVDRAAGVIRVPLEVAIEDYLGDAR